MATNKTICLVTGANKGIGYEIVKKLAAEQPSYHILLGSRNLEKGNEALKKLGSPPNVSVLQLDVSSDSSLTSAVNEVSQHFGRLDILVNNAGVAGLELPEDISPREKFNTIYNVNVSSVAVLSEAFAPLLDKSSRASVVMISSGLGSIQVTLTNSFWQDWTPYSASKSALNGLAAHMLRKHEGWKINCVNPGYTKTELNRSYDDPRSQPVEVGAIRAVELCVEMGKSDGPNGTNSDKNGPVPW